MIGRLYSRIHPHILAVLLIVVIAALPLITRPGLPRHTDLELHVFRAAEFQRLLTARPFEYPRWAPDFYYGYGYPVFNYYAPLPYYAASLFALIPSLGIVAAVKGVLLLTFALAAFGTYFFARRHFGSAAGLIASAAYVLSPYVLFIDPFMRGDAAEFLALGILPWVFLAFDRPLVTTRDVGRASLALAALVFSHNLTALIGAALLAAWVMWRGVWIDGVGRWRRDLAAMAIAAGLTTIFWLPFVVERSAVRLDVTGAGHFDFRNHFVEIGTLLRPSPVLDLGATTPHFIYNLGLCQWLLALPALLAFRHRSRPAARVTAFFVCLSVALVLLISPVSRFAWEAVPAAAFIQFPWRFLGPAALALAMCAGYSVTTLQSASIAIGGRPVRPVAVLALMGVLAFALPTMYPPLWDPDFGDSSPRGILDFELSGVALGTTSTGDFVPTSVSRIPPPNLTLIDTIRDGRVADRFDSAGAPGTRVKPDHLNDLAAAYSVEAPAGFTARFYVFAFPGWQAFVDGQPVTSHPSQGDGFIQFEVPASARSFGIRFESTPPRTIGNVASLASVLVAAALFVTPILRKAPTPGGQPANYPTTQHSNYPTTQLSNYSTRPLTNPLFLSLVTFLILKVAVLDRCDTCFRYTSPPGQALAASTVQSANFGNHIALLGFDPPRLEVEAGQILPLTLYWKATAPVPINYQVFAHLTRPTFILWGQSDKLNPGDFPSTRWPLDKYVWDDHRLRVLPGTPPGEYAVDVGLYTLGDGRRAPVFDASGAVVGDSVQLDLPVHVARPSQPPSIDSLGMQTRLDVRRGGVTLLGASIEQVRLAHPNFARFTLFWQASIDAPGNFAVRARLIDAVGKTAKEIITAPAGGTYPTSAWRAGEIVRDVYAFWLPPDFPAGVYDIRVNLEGEEEPTQPAIDVGQLEVTDK